MNKTNEYEEAMKHLRNMFEMAGQVTLSMMQFNESEGDNLNFVRMYREADEFLRSKGEDE